MHKLTTELKTLFYQHKNKQLAANQAAYLKNQFEFCGISKPMITILEKPLFKKYPLTSEQELISVLTELWQLPEREFQYTAMNLARKHKKLWSPAIFLTFKQLIILKSWWDTVDELAVHMIGGLLKTYPALIPNMKQWVLDQNLWIRRTALLFQLSYKENTDTELLFDFCTRTMHEKEFFIKKAIGWALRQYSKTNPDAVCSFLKKHQHQMKPLSVREASKYL